MKSIALAQNMEHNYHTVDTLIHMEHFHRNINDILYGGYEMKKREGDMNQ